MRIAILSAEAVPFSKTGGLGDVAGALPKALRANGADAFLITPLYETTDRRHLNGILMDDLAVEWRGGLRRTWVWYSEAAGAPTYLIDAPEYFQRNSIYGFRDDHERFAFLCRAAFALCLRLGKPPDILHANDWHTAFAPVELLQRRHWDSFYARTRSVLSLHNLAYQGVFAPSALWELGFGEQRETNYFLADGAANALKAGLLTADAISTVSPTYAREVQTRENGYGLDWVLRQRSERFIGIANGVDYETWNPATDKHLPAHFTTEYLQGKRECKRALLRYFHLPEELDRPIIANISRLTSQKGYDLIKEAGGALLDTGAFFIALGAGAADYENFLQTLRDHAPHRVGIYRGFNEPLAHLIEAGADIFLMPSLFEPCGLNQMYSLRYGTVPIVRATGGLQDTVADFDRASKTGTGFKFTPYRAAAMLEKIHEALYCYAEPEIWRQLQLNGMRADNSWQAAARNYLQLYAAAMSM